LNVSWGVLVSSIRYSVFREGRTIKINRIAGSKVQIVSISCPSIKNLLKFFIIAREVTKYRVRIVVRIRMIIVWS